MSRSLIVVLALGVSSVAAAQPTATQVVADVDAAYAGVAKAQLEFDQKVTNPAFGTTTRSAGRIYIERPGNLRWEYWQTRKGKKTVTKIFITNGTTLTFIDKPNRQVVVSQLCGNSMPAAMSFLSGTGSIGTGFNPAIKSASSTAIELELTPVTTTTQYTSITLEVDPTTHQVNSSTVLDPAKQTNRFELKKYNANASFASSLFNVSLKKLAKQSYKIVNQPQSCPAVSAAGQPSSGSGQPVAPSGSGQASPSSE
jgi:outer membrane lipoprotein-sorting protein